MVVEKKKVIKILSLFLAFTFMIQISGGSVFALDWEDINNNEVNIEDGMVSIQDVEPPVFNGVNFSSNSVKPGDVLDIYVDVADELSGIERVKMGYSIGNDIHDYIYLSFDAGSQKYKYSINITEEMKFKKLKISQLDAIDKAGNQLNLWIDRLSQYTISITDEGGQVDIIGPVFNDITINKDILKVGEKLELTLRASDDISGIERIEGGISIGTEYKNLEFLYDESSSSYKYSLDIEEEMIYSKIRLNWITLYDNSENYTQVEMDILNNIQASVVGIDGTVDNDPPVFNELIFDKYQVTVGDKLEIYVDATDELSDVYEVAICISIGEQSIPDTPMYYDELSKKFKCVINVTDDMYYKKIKVQYLNMRDNAGNQVYVYEKELGNNVVYVLGENGELDDTVPILNGISTNISVPKPGDILEIYIDAIDENSGIGTIYLDYEIKDRYYMTHFDYDAVTKQYKSTIAISEDMKYGKIKFQSLNIYDVAGNNLKLDSSELGKYDLYIADENGVVDTKGPIVKEISFSSTEVKVGEVLDVFINVEDAVSGMNEVQIYIKAGDKYTSGLASYDEISGKYKYSIEITKDMEYKSVEVNYLIIIDNAGNSINLRNESLLCDKVQVVNSNGQADTLIPRFIGLEVSSNRVKVGEKVTIAVEASDDMSGVKTVEASIQQGNNYNNIILNYDESIKKYIYEFVTTEDMIFKKYEILMISIKDNAENISSSKPTKNNFIYVENTQGDINDINVEVTNVAVSSNVGKVGERIKLEVEINLNPSEIQMVRYFYEISGVEECMELAYNRVTHKYEGFFEINEKLKYSRIKPYGFDVLDKAGRYISVGGKFLSKLFIDIPGDDGTVDTMAPELKWIKFDKEAAMVGEIVNITAEASDEKSGIANFEIFLNNSERINLKYNEEMLRYEGSFVVKRDEFNYNSKICMSGIDIFDKAGNYKRVNEMVYENLLVKIIDDSGYIDNVKPVLNEFTMSKLQYDLGENPALILDIYEDESGLDYVQVEIENLSGTKSINYRSNQLSSDIRVVIKFDFYNFSFNDIYRVKKIDIVDKAGNKSTYLEGFDKLKFTIGNYMENVKVKLDMDTISEGQTTVKGKASIGNVKIKLMRNMYGNGMKLGMQVIDETVCDSSGNFKLNLDYMNAGSELLAEAYDMSTGEVLGYEIVTIYQSSDVNMDNIVDIEDLAQVAIYYNEESPRAGSGLESYLRYKSDINRDGIIDIYDLVLVGKYL